MTAGIIARFRTMAIARSSVLTGHVLGALARTLVSVAILLGVAFALGYRTSADGLAWLGAIGLVALLTFALTWLAVAVGLLAKTAQGTNPFVLIIADIAVPEQRVRAARRDVAGGALARAVRTVHADHRHAARAAAGHADRRQRHRGDRLVRRACGDRLLLVEHVVQAGSEPLTRRCRNALRISSRSAGLSRQAYDDIGLVVCLSVRVAGDVFRCLNGHDRVESAQEVQALRQRDQARGGGGFAVEVDHGDGEQSRAAGWERGGADVRDR